MVTVTSSHAYTWRASRTFLLQRLGRIYPIYWITSAAMLVGVILFPGAALPQYADWQYIGLSFLLYPQEQLPMLFVGWTLIHELYFYLIFSVLLLMPGIWRFFALLGWATLVYYGFLRLNPPVSEPEQVILFNPLTLEFICGCLAGWLVKHVRIPAPSHVFSAAFIVAAISVWLWLSRQGEGLPGNMDRILYFLPSALLLLLGATGLEQRGHLLSTALEKIGDASYSLYLTHMLTLAPMYKIWRWAGTHEGLLDNSLALLCMLLVSIGTGILFAKWIEKPLLLQTRQWIRKTHAT
jgi:peptidoglycan/LPS O-acetylase OafA/YrhL